MSMSEQLGLLGRKVGMMRIFTDDGDAVPVTVLDVSDNRLVELEGLDLKMVVALGENGVKTLEDLAGCATDDLIGWTEQAGGRDRLGLHLAVASPADAVGLLERGQIKRGPTRDIVDPKVRDLDLQVIAAGAEGSAALANRRC